MKKSVILKRVFSLMGREKWKLALICVFALVSTVFTVIAPSVMGSITTLLYQGVRTGAFDWAGVVRAVIALAVLYGLAQTFSYVQNVGINSLSARFTKELSDSVYQKVHRLPLGYFDSVRQGEVLSVLTNDVSLMTHLMGQPLTVLVTQVVTAVGVLGMMLSISVALTLVAVLLVPLSLLLSRRLISRIGAAYQERQALVADMNGFLEEQIKGHAVVKAFQNEEASLQRFQERNEALRRCQQKADTASGLLPAITAVVNYTGYALLALIGFAQAVQGRMTVGSVQAMLQYSRQVAQPFQMMAQMWGSMSMALAAAERVFTLLDEPEERDESALMLREKDDGARFSGQVTFRNVCFGYQKDKPLFENLNLDIAAGQKVAIVGPTGAGKTTLVNLLMRFYEVDAGEILLDGVNIADMSRHRLREHLGMVLQDTWLFEGTVKENLAFGREGMTDETVAAAAQNANIHAMIAALPNGYDMELKKGAENLSQGEKQLLTIARAMGRSCDIMILDESTSNVDVYTEQDIIRAMQRLLKGRTGFVIAHRLSTIQDADLILYMENGRIVETGTHQSLMGLGGAYAQMYQSQFEILKESREKL